MTDKYAERFLMLNEKIRPSSGSSRPRLSDCKTYVTNNTPDDLTVGDRLNFNLFLRIARLFTEQNTYK